MLPPESSSSASRWLAAGAALGLVAAVAGIVQPGPRYQTDLPPGAAASIEGAIIEQEALERAVGLLAADSKNPIGEAEREHVLDRLIEEELLVQRARELGVDLHDRRVRSLLVASMIDLIVADAQPEEPSAAELDAFFAENSGYFARSGRLHVRALRVARRDGESEDEARMRADAAATRLREGEEHAAVEAALGDPQIVTVPRGLLPMMKLREYLGPTPTAAAALLEVGEIGEPVRGGRSWFVLEVLDREPPQTPPLEEVENEVRAEMLRRAGDQALRSYLEDLRSRADVVVRPGATDLPETP